MHLQDIMSTEIETISANESAEKAWNTMRLQQVHHLVVLDKDRSVVGIVSDRDLGGSHGESLRTGKTVADVMTPHVATATPHTTVREAANLLRGRIIGCLPVMEGKKLVGVITITDLLELIGRGVEHKFLNQERPTVRAVPPYLKPGGGKPIT